MSERMCPACGTFDYLNPTGCAMCRAELQKLVGKRPPDGERAKRIARERGWLTDDGWIWDVPRG